MSAFLASPLGLALTVVLVFAAILGPVARLGADPISPRAQKRLDYLSVAGLALLLALRVLPALLG